MAQAVEVFQASIIQLIVGCPLLDCTTVKKEFVAPLAPKREGRNLFESLKHNQANSQV